ncbi:MAG TPA: methionine ABC transporter ATP-binding protein [Gammaproteobacteria bacterium]|nr:methionine ABC transporter ATP-binding protein [Gammaproteobacteria bacterium]
MIILEHINKNYMTSRGPVAALQDINLEIKAGEIYGIIGQSGAGKSTLIRCVNLLEKPTDGKIFIENAELTALSEDDLRKARRKIGMIFQHFNLLNSRTVYENIALPLELGRQNKQEIAKTINPLLELTGLSDKKKYYPAQLSGGQKQRVAIARALASNPHVLLSDEATSALDPETTHTILDLLKNIRNTLNLTILLITHEMSVIKACCDRVGILQAGRLIEENEVGEFFAHPKTAIAKSFIVSSLKQTLPSIIEEQIAAEDHPEHHPILRLWFFGGAATKPIMAQLMNQFNLRINILQANVEYIKKHAMGIMILAISGEKKDIAASIQHLQQLGVQVEVLGYVPNDIIPFA